MKKYLYLLMVAAFAVMTLTLTACSDDDEPNGGSSNGKWQTVSIDGKDFYNCLDAFVYVSSSYEIEDGYVYENGHYQEIEKANFNIFLYDEKSIEAEGSAEIFLSIPSSSFTKGKNITSDIIDLSVGVHTDDIDWSYGEDDRNLTVLGGTVKVAELKNGKATVKFSDFKVKLNGKTIVINGEATCEEY